MTRRTGRWALVVGLVLALATACSSGSSSNSGGGGGNTFLPPTGVSSTAVVTTPPTTSTSDVVDETSSGNGPSTCDRPGEQRDQRGACAPCPDFEGCFDDPTDMEYFYNVVIASVNTFSTTTYEKMPAPKKWLYVPTDVTGKEGCTEAGGSGKQAFYTEYSYEYCPADQIVYVGELGMWRYYQLGDAAPAIAIAHEWGHHVQQQTGVYRGYAGLNAEQSRLYTIRIENQADCIAGAWFGWAASQGVVTQDDYADADNVIADVASLEQDNTRYHGTLRERTDSFIAGMQKGIYSCAAFFPNTLIITQ